MKNYQQLLANYASYHQTRIILWTHLLGVPLIIIAIQMLLSWAYFPIAGKPITLAWILYSVVALYYAFLALRATWLTILILFALTWVAQFLSDFSFSIYLCVACFIVGWLAQLVGHYLEGNKPAFQENLWHILIAPIFLTSEVAAWIRKAIQ